MGASKRWSARDDEIEPGSKDGNLRTGKRYPDPYLRCTASLGVESLDRSNNDGAVVRSAWLHQYRRSARCARGRTPAHRDAWARWQRLSDEGRISRGHAAGATRFTNIAIDKDGNHLLEGETTVILSEIDGKTTLTLQTHAIGLVPIASQMLAGMEAGWNQSIDKLAELFLRSAAR